MPAADNVDVLAGPAAQAGGPAPAAELLSRMGVLEIRVREVLSRRRAADPNPDDPHRGLYVTDERVDALAQGRRRVGFSEPLPGQAGGRLAELGRRFDLDDLDLDLITLALAPDLDARFEPIYGYLNDDVTRRRATIGMALELCGHDPADFVARRHLTQAGPIVGRRLMVVEETDRPFLSRGLRVPDTVTAWLLGDDQVEPELADVSIPAVTSPVDDVEEVKRAVTSGVRLLYVRETLESRVVVLAVQRVCRAGHARRRRRPPDGPGR